MLQLPRRTPARRPARVLALVAAAAAAAPAANAAGDVQSWLVGDPADAVVDHEPGLVLAGGGGDNDEAMRWMLERAAGGDVVVIRISGGDGYNDYLFSQLGVPVDSVETIRITSPAEAEDPGVLARVAGAEALFIAGGDQTAYVEAWRGTALADAIDALVNDKGAVVGGTSAGMMILGGTYYAPETLGVLSEEALADPYHPYMASLGYDDFLSIPRLADTVTDTHFGDREREGRLLAFMARMETDRGVDAFAIACDDFTAVVIDGDGRARVFGEWPAFPDEAFFLRSRCAPPASQPETCVPGTPLTWDREDHAVEVYRVPGTPDGDGWFDLSDWTSGDGGQWHAWWVEDGVRFEAPLDGPADCPCPADLDGSGTVGFEDVVAVTAAWGGGGAADLDGDGAVALGDLLLVLAAWGPCGG